MALAEVSWEDQAGISRGAFAKMEDTSRSGACIRVAAPINVGSKVKIKWHKEQFSGVAKYCRSDGEEFLLGVKRNISENNAITGPSPESIMSNIHEPLSAEIKDVPAQQEDTLQQLSVANVKMGSEPQLPSTGYPAVTVSGVVIHETKTEADPRDPQLQESETNRHTESQTQELSQLPGRTNMLNKWFRLGSGYHQKDSAGENKNGTHGPGNRTTGDAAPVNHTNGNGKDKALANFQTNLLMPEDIYRAAGIISLRLGYGINNVVDMLNSEHMRGLSNDVKRASVLMALEVAGIPVDEVLRDAAQRQDSIIAYETTQRKLIEEYEVRKVQENAQIQEEIERITAHLVDGMKQNLDEVALAKEAFRNWQTTKLEEVQRISEAAGLCMKQPAPEPPVKSLVALQAVGFATKS